MGRGGSCGPSRARTNNSGMHREAQRRMTPHISLAFAGSLDVVGASLQMQASKSKQRLRVAPAVLAGWVVMLLLAAQAAAVSPDLHDWLHADAQRVDHDCAAVLLQKGCAEGSPLVVVVPALPPAGRIRLVSADSLPLARSWTLPAERGPPRA